MLNDTVANNLALGMIIGYVWFMLICLWQGGGCAAFISTFPTKAILPNVFRISIWNLKAYSPFSKKALNRLVSTQSIYISYSTTISLVKGVFLCLY